MKNRQMNHHLPVDGGLVMTLKVSLPCVRLGDQLPTKACA